MRDRFGGLREAPLEALIADNLLSPFQIRLPRTVLQQAEMIVKGLFSLRENRQYQERVSETYGECFDPGNYSLMMSYDFHIDSEQKLQLIEVNTNAAFLAMGTLFYESLGIANPVAEFSLSELNSCIKNEIQRLNSTWTPHLAEIIDENPSEQRLYIEFLIVAELFKEWGWKVNIKDYRSNLESHSFVYNRLTDFYLSRIESIQIKKMYEAKEICLSPNPHEYFLLADKARLIDWSQDGFLEGFLNQQASSHLRQHLPHTTILNKQNYDEIWAKRKTQFFKPKNEYGSKQSFKGASISRRVYEDLANSDAIAQEYIPAPEVKFETSNGLQSFKYDLRVFAYKDQVQSVIARLYQGQVTNLRTPQGGFAAVCFF